MVLSKAAKVFTRESAQGTCHFIMEEDEDHENEKKKMGEIVKSKVESQFKTHKHNHMKHGCALYLEEIEKMSRFTPYSILAIFGPPS